MDGTLLQTTDIVQMRQGIYLSDMVDPLGYHQPPPLQYTSQSQPSLDVRQTKATVTATIDDTPQGAGAGTESGVLCISPVCAWYGALWQWRTVRCNVVRPSTTSTVHTSAQRVAGQSSKQPITCLVPFMLFPSADALLRHPCVSVEALCRDRKATGLPFAATDVVSVVVDSALGSVPALLRETEASCYAVSAVRQTEQPTYRVSPPRAATVETSRYMSWYEAQFRLLEQQVALLSQTPAAAAHVRIHPEMTECTTHRQPNETRAAYSQRRWDTLRAGLTRPKATATEGDLKTALPVSYLRIFVEAEAEEAVALPEVDRAAQHVAHDTAPAPSPLPRELCNALCGGLAETVLAADRYASLIVRHDLTFAAACWALFCDTRSHGAATPLRDHALAIEREVLAAVAAHERARCTSASASTRTPCGQTFANFDFIHFPSTLQ